MSRGCVGSAAGWGEAAFDLILFVACTTLGIGFLYLAVRRHHLGAPPLSVGMPSLYGFASLSLGLAHLMMAVADSSVSLAFEGTCKTPSPLLLLFVRGV